MLNRLIHNWVYGSFLAGLLLLILTPLLAREWSAALLLIWLALPAYMFHQYEEHDDDRFGRFVNALLGDGHTVLSPQAIFFINVLGVWGLNAAAFVLASTLDIGFGLIAVYLMLINSMAHIAQSILMRAYNPGLITAIIIFLPLGIYSLISINAAGGGSIAMHLIGFGIPLLVHVLIVVHVMRQREKIRRQ